MIDRFHGGALGSAGSGGRTCEATLRLRRRTIVGTLRHRDGASRRTSHNALETGETLVRLMRIVVTAALLGPAVTGCSGPRASEPPEALRLENLLQTTLSGEFTPGREVVVSLVEIPPNTTMQRHWHPGEEFHYYLEGKVTIVIDGQDSIIGTPGAVGHVPFKAMHTAVTGAEGATALVFRVHEAGKPVRYLESGESLGE